MSMKIDDKLLKFISVGIVNTIAGMIIMFGMYNLLGCSYWVSSATNYVIVSVMSYILNRSFTFKYSGNVVHSGVRFVINIAVCYLAAYGIAKPLMILMLGSCSIAVRDNMALLTGMCIFTCLNYIGQRMFVFREGKMEHIKIYESWLNSSVLSETEKDILKKMDAKEKYEAFYKHAEFGTAGMRAIMGLGINRLNKYTIRMAAKGLAQLLGEGSKVAVAYDTRNHSVEFAEETAKVLAASGIKVFLFDRHSPVPLLSYAVRFLGCDGGVVITASHNTKEYNGFKVYDATGCQMNEEMAGKIAENISVLEDSLDIKTEELGHNNIQYVGEEVVEGFLSAVSSCDKFDNKEAAADLKIVYTSLHGSGREYVNAILEKAGFNQVIQVKEQADFNGDFPTVKKPNPEDKAAFEIAEKKAVESGADIIIGTDPDCDRIGVGAVVGGHVEYFTGNQIGVMLIDFLARMDKESKGKKLVTTIVTSDMGKTVAESFGIEVIKTFTGFKNIGAEMNSMSDGSFFMGYEESYGYLPGTHARDKDGVSSALMICRMAAYHKAHGLSLKDVLSKLYKKHGYWIDHQQSFTFEGSAGVQKMNTIMDNFRSKGAEAFAGVEFVDEILDYSKGIEGFPHANVLKFMFSGGSWIAIRPSGTEPKIKFYYSITADKETEANERFISLKKCIEALVLV